MIARVAITFVAVLGIVGCVTHDWIAKSAAGRVIDATSGKGISAVAIYRVLDDKSVFVGATDSEGRFDIPATSRTFVTLPMPGDPGYFSYLVFRASGYRDEKISCGTITGEVVDRKPPSLPPLIVKLRKRPNQSLERTADRREDLLSMTSILKPEAKRAVVSGRSALSR
jgi:hypothetical protein